MNTLIYEPFAGARTTRQTWIHISKIWKAKILIYSNRKTVHDSIGSMGRFILFGGMEGIWLFPFSQEQLINNDKKFTAITPFIPLQEDSRAGRKEESSTNCTRAFQMKISLRATASLGFQQESPLPLSMMVFGLQLHAATFARHALILDFSVKKWSNYSEVPFYCECMLYCGNYSHCVKVLNYLPRSPMALVYVMSKMTSVQEMARLGIIRFLYLN